jgi:hypothetical protein
VKLVWNDESRTLLYVSEVLALAHLEGKVMSEGGECCEPGLMSFYYFS